jgi:anti-sigma B factor antagonist
MVITVSQSAMNTLQLSPKMAQAPAQSTLSSEIQGVSHNVIQNVLVKNRRITVIQPSCTKLDRIEASGILQTIETYVSTNTLIGRDSNTHFLIDMRNIELLDTSGLNVLLIALKNAIASGTTLSLCSVQDSVKLVFEITRMDEFFNICDNYETFVSIISD